jgi:hypothetical protein
VLGPAIFRQPSQCRRAVSSAHGGAADHHSVSVTAPSQLIEKGPPSRKVLDSVSYFRLDGWLFPDRLTQFDSGYPSVPVSR